MCRLLKKGDRVKLKTSTIMGNSGLGTITQDECPIMRMAILKLDGKKAITHTCRHEVSHTSERHA